ncbi:MAG: DUF3795 domain-containing protein [Acidobacteria bacterium]|nr:DUF3795 domain-containing protein [Acidobacteriota bacterium]
MEEIMIAPCGMNCSVCVAYLAMKNDLKKKGFSRSYCAGCRPRGKNCAFMKKKCEKLGEGLIQFCYKCENFPCQRLKHLDKRYRTKYHLSMIENLNFIKANGMEKFLAREEAKWRCPQCGGTISCHVGLCLQCSLDTWKQNRKYRWGEQ